MLDGYEDPKHLVRLEKFDLDTPGEITTAYSDILLRVKQDTVYTITETYRWYAEGSRYPVLETESVQRVSGDNVSLLSENTYVFHPIDQEGLPEDTANLALRNKKSVVQNMEYPAGNENITVAGGFTVKIYPNPVVSDLQVSVQLSRPEPVEVSLYNLQGQILYRRSFPVQGESAVETVNMSRFGRGSYILKIQAGEKSERKVIIKQ
ncbi:hypothetical protein FACS1894155_00020 [Bacteroidia bacterium]|nr:hypothetical protein FACS189455_0390 [Bacteroidia bacterium]GHU87285.1 hypothetical protein FACS1894155_00020 [Bacteroidia bacterium]